MAVPVPAGNHPVSAIVTAPGRAIVAAQVSLASGRANMGNVTGTLPVANGGTGATNASDARANLGIFPMTTEQVDEVMDDDTAIVSDNTVNGTVFSYIWGKIKAWAAAAFAPISHTHTQSQINDTPISVANGGTGSTTASDARTSLGITPANIGAAAATHNHAGQALTPASITATGAISGSSVSDSVGSLASLRESVSLVGVERLEVQLTNNNLYFNVYRNNNTYLSVGFALSTTAKTKHWLWDSANSSTYFSG